MHWHLIEDKWHQYKDAAHMLWSRLSDEHLDLIAGNRDRLSGHLQQVYGISSEEAERQINAFEDRSRTNTWPNY